MISLLAALPHRPLEGIERFGRDIVVFRRVDPDLVEALVAFSEEAVGLDKVRVYFRVFSYSCMALRNLPSLKN